MPAIAGEAVSISESRRVEAVAVVAVVRVVLDAAVAIAVAVDCAITVTMVVANVSLLFLVWLNHDTHEMPTSHVRFFMIYSTTELNNNTPNKSKSRSNQSEASS